MINKSKLSFFLVIVFILFFSCFLGFSYHFQKKMTEIYKKRESPIVKDRKGEELFILPNEKGYFVKYLDKIPPKFKELLIKKEDKYFKYHLGINPVSTFRAARGYFNLGPKKPSSTISQQLAKILLGNELERNLKNKIIESFYALCLEIFQPKEKILKMYANSIYFGNQAQGIAVASQIYFNLPPELLTQGQILQLLAAISSPSQRNPAEKINEKVAFSIVENLGLEKENLKTTNWKTAQENIKKYFSFNESYFEIKDLIKNDFKIHQLTIDGKLNKKIREIVKRNLGELKEKGAKNAAVIVISLPENEILALIGSPNPQSFENENQINMLFQPRAIGSTVKPFIYLKAFEKGLRPYTLVDDREYRYITGIGFPLYPKNFDYKYRGLVNLHYSLSNSLNVPTVKVLEYLGVNDFADFFEKDLGFEPVQDWENYQLGIGLGCLEMSLMDLAKFYTIFPNQGMLKELKIYSDQAHQKLGEKVAWPEYIQLINKILNDRQTGIDQFGLKSDLNLSQRNYALKTGTSRSFLDSWTIGFTPDFLVGVWIGNADLTPLDAISGQQGAGRIWSEIMELLFNSEYNKKTPFELNLIKEFEIGEKIEYGLAGDDYQRNKNILMETDKVLILRPHHYDRFLFEENGKIILKAKERVNWFINGEFLDSSQETFFTPKNPGQYQIEAENEKGVKEKIKIILS